MNNTMNSSNSTSGKQHGPDWPISHSYDQTKEATGWVEVGPACVPWYGGFKEKNAALKIAQLIAAAPDLLAICKKHIREIEAGSNYDLQDEFREAIAKAEGRTS